MTNKFSAREVEIARRMTAAGIPGDLGLADQALAIRQEGGSSANSLSLCYLTSKHMGSAIETYIKVVCKQSAPFIVCGFELRLSIKDTPAILLPDPADPEAPRIYKFSEYSASRFDKSQVILQSSRTLRRGQSLEGYLLAIDPDPVRPEIQHGARVIAKLTIFDQFDEGHSTDLLLSVDRSAEWRPKPVAPKPRARLFDKPDKIFGTLPCDTNNVVEANAENFESAVIGK